MVLAAGACAFTSKIVTCKSQVSTLESVIPHRTRTGGDPMAVLEELQASVARISDQVGPSVVGVVNGWSHGSGAVFAAGRILTNAHNIRGDEMTVAFDDGRSVPAKVVGVDPDGDLAVLEADTAGAKPLD